MILDWRELDRDNRLPFIVVQIADTRQDEGWIAVQRAQAAAAQMIPFVQTVVSGDVCEKRNSSRNKGTIGQTDCRYDLIPC